MPIRDILILASVFGIAAGALYRPWWGICGYAWISYMNPHRFTWETAYAFPVAMIVAAPTLLGMILGRDRTRFPEGGEAKILGILWAFFSFTTFFAFNETGAREELIRVSKILLMTYATMFLINDRYRVNVFLTIITFSIGLLGLKGSLFAFKTGGEYMVFGPPQSFLEDNNDFAHAVCMVIPLIVWLKNQQTRKYLKNICRIMIGTSILSVLITYSRGGFLTLTAVLGLYLLRSKRKHLIILVIIIGIIVSVPFLPQKWYDRMESIQDYNQDLSVIGRFNAWHTAWNVAKDMPLTGGGFQMFTSRTFDKYAPDPDNVHDVHSIYFEVLGEHGFVAFFIFFGMIATCILSLQKMKKYWHLKTDQWGSGLCDALLISFAAYLVGGFTLGRVSFDLFYHLIAMVVILKTIIRDEEIAQDTKNP
ncbi:MAG: putative O-glycosylation ligase, exosortase A system-associated [Thermodesulfobacteriota bacterium]|nr:putative O-glycosylation ligase, exosortase A system-associated [Thermodesulfobacteriota bacterium]